MIKKITTSLANATVKKANILAFSLLALGAMPASLLAQQSYTFTNASATGATGPTQLQVTTAYQPTNLNGSVTVSGGGIQSFTVPATGLYQIGVWGAAAGHPTNYPTKFGGLGSSMQGEFNLTAGTVLNILVGQKGSDGCGGSGGGGGTYVTSGAVLLIAAGGGGGGTSDQNGANSVTVTTGTNDNPGGTTPGGSNGLGGSACNVGSPGANHGGGGGGYTGNGATSTAPTPGGGGFSFINGGAGGTGNAPGGFGGGGGATNCTVGGGGGGGYSGGAGGQQVNYCTAGLQRTGGGGGGSYNGGGNQVNSAGTNTTHGKAIITALCNISLTSSSINGNGPICSGQSVTLTTNAVSNYSWSNGSNASSLVLSPTVTTSYTLTATSMSNCVASSVITVTVDNTPTVTAVSSSTAVCAGKTLTLTASGANTYTWVGGSGSITNGQGFIPSATAVYTVTGTNACGSSSASLAVTVNALPNIGAIASTATLCTGGSLTLNGTGSAGGYNWDNGVTNNVAFVPAVTNTYIVTGSSAQNCTNTAAVTVTVYITPTVAPVASPTAICVGKTSTLSATGASSGYTWNITPPVYTSSITVSPLATTVYTVIRASGSCTSTATISVVVNPLPNLQVSTPNPSVVCANSAASLAAAGAITYTWFPGGFQGSNITVYPNYSASPIDYTVVASNANCTISAISTISTNPNPNITISATSSLICAGSTTSLTANGAVTYTWVSPPVGAAQQSQQTVTVNPLIPTLYSVSGTNVFGCTSGASQVVLVNAAPNATLTILNPGGYICGGGVGTLIAVGMGPMNYNWLNNGATTSSITVTPIVSTEYTVVATNPSTGCQSTATSSLAVYISTFVISSPTAVCKGSTVTISASGAANSYTWVSGIPIASNTPSISVSPAINTIYNVIGSTGACNTTQTVSLLVNQIPNVTASALKPTICRYEPGALLASGATSYSWTGGPGTAGYTVFPTVTSTYVVIGTDNNNCSKTVIVTQLVATCIGIEEQSGLESLLSIYPNPSSGEFTIQAESAMNISIVNELGQLIKTARLTERDNRVNISQLAEGIYFIRAEKDGTTFTRKVIVSK